MLTLAGKIWGMSPGAALEKMVSLGLPFAEEHLTPEKIESYEQQHPQRQHRFQQLWQASQEHLIRNARSTTVNHLRHRFRLHLDVSSERWRNGPNRLFGALPFTAVEGCFYPGSMRCDYNKKSRNPSMMRMFRGRHWDDVLVMPWYDLPERICAFSFVGRNGDANDHVMRPLRLMPNGRKETIEAGLYGLPIALEPNVFGRYLFAVDDPFLAARIQMRHFGVSTTALPIVAWHDSDGLCTDKAWQALDGRTTIFWSWRMTARVLNQAIKANGYLCLAGPEELTIQNIDHYIRLCSARDLLHKLQRQAKPWAHALSDWIRESNEGAVAELMLHLRRYQSPEEIAKHCDVDARQRLEPLLPAGATAAHVMVGRHKVFEKLEGGWYFINQDTRARDAEQIIDASLRLDEVFYEKGEAHYRGRIIYRGETLPFIIKAKSLGRRTARWMYDFVLDAGKGCLKIRPGWSRSALLQISLAFQEPVILPSPASPDR